MNRRISYVIAGWRTGLSRPVLILQAGNALNYFGYGLVLPFEIIYLHQIRGFSTSTAGLVLAAIMGTVGNRHPADGSAARPVLRQSDRGRRKLGERPWLRRLRLRRPSLAGFCVLDCRRSRARRGRDGQPDIGRQVGHARAASGRLRAEPRRRQLRYWCGRDRRRLHRRSRAAAQLVPNSLFLRRRHLRRIRADRARCRTEPASGGRHSDRRQRNRLSRRRSRSALPHCDRSQHRARRRRPHVLLQHPAAICKGAHTGRPRRDRDHHSGQHRPSSSSRRSRRCA